MPTVSDVRLKCDIVKLSELPNDGLHLYRYGYLWSDVICVGVMAQEVAAIAPTAGVRGADAARFAACHMGRVGQPLSSGTGGLPAIRFVSFCHPEKGYY